jgi:uroporphyrinogen-III synthase
MATNKRRMAEISLRKMNVLITRPKESAKRTARVIESLGHTTTLAPVSSITTLNVDVPYSQLDALITTSANAIEIMATQTERRDIPLFCVGAASADFARELGFQTILYPEVPGATGLIEVIKTSPYRRLAYLHGEIVKVDIKRVLSQSWSQDSPQVQNLQIDSFCVYKTEQAPSWSDEIIAQFHEETIAAITFYSERSAELTLNFLKKHGLLRHTASIHALCLSHSIAEKVLAYFWKSINIASTTRELIGNLEVEECNKG